MSERAQAITVIMAVIIEVVFNNERIGDMGKRFDNVRTDFKEDITMAVYLRIMWVETKGITEKKGGVILCFQERYLEVWAKI